MTRVTLTAAAAVAAVLAAPALGAAAGTTATTTARATTQLGSGTLPDSTIDATWTKWKSGKAATLEVGGTSIIGTTSTAAATWSSQDFVVSGRSLVAAITQTDERTVAVPGTFERTLRVRHRDAGGAWSRWMPLTGRTVVDGTVAVTPTNRGWDVVYSGAMRARQQLQVEALYRIADTSSNDLFTTVVLVL